MRKSFDTLSVLVTHALGEDPLSGHLFCFCNRARNRMKVLYFDGSGLWVSAKRLEKGTFAWPGADARKIELTGEELTLLVGGLDLRSTRKRRWFSAQTIPRKRAQHS